MWSTSFVGLYLVESTMSDPKPEESTVSSGSATSVADSATTAVPVTMVTDSSAPAPSVAQPTTEQPQSSAEPAPPPQSQGVTQPASQPPALSQPPPAPSQPPPAPLQPPALVQPPPAKSPSTTLPTALPPAPPRPASQEPPGLIKVPPLVLNRPPVQPSSTASASNLKPASPATASQPVDSAVAPVQTQFAGAINLTISNGSINYKAATAMPVSSTAAQGTPSQSPAIPTAARVSIAGPLQPVGVRPQMVAVTGISASISGDTIRGAPAGMSLLAQRQPILINSNHLRPMNRAGMPQQPRPGVHQGMPVVPIHMPRPPTGFRPRTSQHQLTQQPLSSQGITPVQIRTLTPSGAATLTQASFRPGAPPRYSLQTMTSRPPQSLIGQPALRPGPPGATNQGSVSAKIEPADMIGQPRVSTMGSLVNKQTGDVKEEPTSSETDSSRCYLGSKTATIASAIKEEVKKDPETVKPDSTGVRESERGPSDQPPDSAGGEIDALEWQNGIGTLPGSDLKFKINEFGVIEMVTEDMDLGDGMTGKIESDNSSDKIENASDSNASTSIEFRKGGEEICRCENCGVYGLASEFCNSGRFCSRSCVGAFAGKSRRGGVKKQQSVIEKPLTIPSGMKRKKRRFTDDDDFDYSVLKHSVPGEEGIEVKKVFIPGKKSRTFSWSQYLEQEKAQGAPPKIFREPFPVNKNGFKFGMKLEGIDPRHPSLYCVLSVAEVRGYRLRLHFDCYSECYDFWTNADSPFIFPAGWAEKNGKTLQPPKGFTTETFNWTSYLKMSKYPAAPKHLFTTTQVNSVTPHGFRVGMKLEAVDKKNQVLTCVATVADVLGDRVLIHFDGWEDSYDYWCDPSSPYIHPVGWCFENGKVLSPPNDWKDVEGFTWEEYLAQTKTQPVPARAFKPRQAHQYEPGMKVEAVDRRNSILIRCATVAEIEPYRLKIHFDGWSDVYDYWVDDDCPDIHPPSWCAKTGHPLTPPISPEDLVISTDGGCPTPGCKGVGHIKGARYTGHHSAFGCPYSPLNMNKESALQDRLGPTRTEMKEARAAAAAAAGPASPEMKFVGEAGHPKVKYMNGDLDQQYLQRRPGRKKKKHKFLLHGKRKHKEFRDDRSPENKLHDGVHQSVFMAPLVPPAAVDLPHCWEQHSKLLPGVDKFKAKQVSNWSIEEVANFIRTIPGCEEQANVFLEEQIDGEAFLLLNQADIVKIMNIKLGPAIKIFNSILIFKNTVEV